MSEKAFLDTCVFIAFAFHINSLHSLSHIVINSYNECYWSDFVKSEYNNRFKEKLNNLSKFIRDLNIELVNPTKEFYSPQDLFNFVLRRYSRKLQVDAQSSIEPFWEEYMGMVSQIPFYILNKKLNLCLIDLSSHAQFNNNFLENNILLTPQRIKNYDTIESMLKSEGVKEEDRHVALDCHDFAKNQNDLVDFVTFDETLYHCVINIERHSCNSIKGKYDFILS